MVTLKYLSQFFALFVNFQEIAISWKFINTAKNCDRYLRVTISLTFNH